MAAPQINVGSVVAAAASMLISQATGFFVQEANTEIKITSAIAGNSKNWRKKSMARP